jgi:lysophospholipase L1-like esterase
VKILVIGDSIGLPRFAKDNGKVELNYEGTYPELVRKLALRRFAGEDILLVNACRHANTSVHLLRGAANDVCFLQPDVVILQLGMSDLWPAGGRSTAPPFPDLAGKDPWVDESEFAQNMERFLEFCISQPNCRVIIVNIPRCSDRQYRQHLGAQERTRQYNMQLKRIATNSRVDIVDAYALFVELGEAATGSDGIHPTAQCSRQLAEKIVETLARLRDEVGGATTERDGRNH